MFERFARSVGLAKASLAVLRADKELLLFPLVSFVALLIVVISFAVPFAALGMLGDAADGQLTPAMVVLAFLFYVVAYTVIFFFNSALVGAAMIRLDGGDPTLGDGLRLAASRFAAIVAYAVVAATVGMVLRFISERAGIIGQLIGGVLGFAWSVVTFLVVPVLVVERVGPIEAIKRSGGLLRRTWGEQLIGNIGIGIVFTLIGLVVVLLGGLLIVVLAQIAPVLAIAGVVLVVVAVGLVALIGAAVSGIFTASLYRYATKGDAGPLFRGETMAGAFRSKSGPAPATLPPH